MSRANAIRKKALDLVRKRDWEAAIKEYKRLAELEQSNPNVLNELGDLYLKVGNKTEAFDTFSRAIDDYIRVSLHNNAVAVCKKVIRLLPARFEVLAKLGNIRTRQGLGKDAEGHYVSYLDKIAVEAAVDTQEFVASAKHIIEDTQDSPNLLAKVADTLLQHNLKDQAAEALTKLHGLYARQGATEQVNAVAQKLTELGVTMPEMPVQAAPPEVSRDGEIITEENIWTAAHTEGERIDTKSEPQERAGSVFEYGQVDMDKSQSVPAPARPAQTPAPAAAAMNSEVAVGLDEEPADTTVTAEQPRQPHDTSQSEAAPVAPAGVPDASAPVSSEPATPDFAATGSDVVEISSIVDEVEQEVRSDVSEDDYRSHYDLGMAYMEMDLIPEAIREFQFAAKADQFRIKSLEMVGVCFLKKNQASLAIKQLSKGLMLIGETEREALGIKYNLGLAYEMAGDLENAKAQFEDVYVVDVTFRDVANKIRDYSGG